VPTKVETQPKVLQHGISQKRLNELAEDYNALSQALRPFAEIYEQHVLAAYATIAVPIELLKNAKDVLDKVYDRLDERRLAQTERDLAGQGDVCRLCGTIIEGADDFELEGYCSKTCKREDRKSEWPSELDPPGIAQKYTAKKV
jgi:hypothetical protein